MNSDIIKKVQEAFLQEGREEIKTGMELEVHQIIKENGKERIQKFKWLVIKVAGKSEMEKTITVRRKIGAFGVEKIFAIHSSNIQQIDIIRQFKVRRKSIKFIRDLTGKAARLKEVPKKAPKKSAPAVEKKATSAKKAKTEETK
jgi:large subunit ribosomal protein L19